MISTNFIEKLPYTFDIKTLQEEIQQLLTNVPFHESGQISLVYRDGHKDKCWTDGCGSPFEFDSDRNPKRDKKGNIKRRFKEEEFQFLNPGLEKTELSKVYLDLSKEFNLTRYRLAKLNPKKSYGWHKDEEIRIHVPIFTAPGCFIITDDGVASHLPSDGSAYLFYAQNGYHTAVNSDYTIERIHLLINVN